MAGWPVIWSPEAKAAKALDVAIDANRDIFVTGWASDVGEFLHQTTAKWDEGGGEDPEDSI